MVEVSVTPPSFNAVLTTSHSLPATNYYLLTTRRPPSPSLVDTPVCYLGSQTGRSLLAISLSRLRILSFLYNS